MSDGIVNEMREVRLPADLCAAAERKFGGMFASLEELLVCVLRELTADTADELDRTEQRLVEDRLRDLGYI